MNCQQIEILENTVWEVIYYLLSKYQTPKETTKRQKRKIKSTADPLWNKYING